MYLGLDISSSCTGIAILSKDGELLLSDYSKPDSKLDLFDKIKYQLDYIDQLIEKYGIKEIIIEEPLQKFQTGSSSSHTISVLLRTNYAISWVLFDKYGFKPEYLNRSAARKIVCGAKKKGEKDKDICLTWAMVNEPLFNLTTGPRGGIDTSNYDKADAIVLVRAGWKSKKK